MLITSAPLICSENQALGEVGNCTGVILIQDFDKENGHVVIDTGNREIIVTVRCQDARHRYTMGMVCFRVSILIDEVESG